ncbi:hypothetical protein GJ496_007046 [Pomphorhynchus laevis]|nr:hypothetical protein GJ496_007046 [Pomphorhynchus laevis]
MEDSSSGLKQALKSSDEITNEGDFNGYTNCSIATTDTTTANSTNSKHITSSNDHNQNNGLRHLRRVGYALSQAPPRFRRSTTGGHSDLYNGTNGSGASIPPSNHPAFQQHQLATASIAATTGSHHHQQCYSLPFFVHQNGNSSISHPNSNGYDAQFITYPANHMDAPYLLFDGKGYSIVPASMLPPNTSFNNMGYFVNPAAATTMIQSNSVNGCPQQQSYSIQRGYGGQQLNDIAPVRILHETRPTMQVVSTNEKAVQVDLNIANSLINISKLDNDTKIPVSCNYSFDGDSNRRNDFCSDGFSNHLFNDFETKLFLNDSDSTLIDDISNNINGNISKNDKQLHDITEDIDIEFSGEQSVSPATSLLPVEYNNLSDTEYNRIIDVLDSVDETSNDADISNKRSSLTFNSDSGLKEEDTTSNYPASETSIHDFESSHHSQEINTSTVTCYNITSKYDSSPNHAPNNAPKSWASLFKPGRSNLECAHSASTINSSNNVITTATNSIKIKSNSDTLSNNKTPIKVVNGSNILNSVKCSSNSSLSKYSLKCPVDVDDFAKLGKIFRNFECRQWSPALTPRGFFNEGNYCYVNAVIQSLLACPMFFNFVDSLPCLIKTIESASADVLAKPTDDSKDIHAPMYIRHIKSIFERFQPMQRNGQFGKPGQPFRRIQGELKTDTPLNINEFHKIADVLMRSKTKGQQEDAHEFLCRILQELHNECSTCIRMLSPNINKEEEVQEVDSNLEDEDSSEWQEYYGKRVHIHREIPTDVSPISEIFGGYLRTSLERNGAITSSNLEPFHSLSIDAESLTVIQALRNLTARVPVSGLLHPITKKPVKGYQTILIEKLPPCLVLHLKCFSWCDGQKKIFPKMQILVDIIIPQEIMSRTSTSARHYKLFAVIHHAGKSSHNGHYICDVFHPGLPGWIRCDDQKVATVLSRDVLSSGGSPTGSVSSKSVDDRQELTPFILLYRQHKVDQH